MSPREETTPNRHLIFVYGTLKKNQPNCHEMTKKENGDAKFICKAATVEKYPLVLETEYGVPFLLGRKAPNMIGNVSTRSLF